MLDKTNTIKSLTDDILNEIENEDRLEKVAEEKDKGPKTEIGRELIKLAADVRRLANERPRITYQDIEEFKQRTCGL